MQQVQSLTAKSNLVRTASATEFDRPTTPPCDWQTALKQAIRSEQTLRKMLRLPPRLPKAKIDAPEFPTFVPLEFLGRIEPGNPNDPLLRQVLTLPDEFDSVDGFDADPVGDLDAIKTAGVLHKYDGRALVITTGACGVHCRYCFRREFPYAQVGDAKESYRHVVDYIAQTPSIDEVLLSGGDPLTLVDEKLFDLITQIESIDHVRRMRIHSRMPVVIPQRVTSALVDRFRQSRLTVWFVIHMNHANEFDWAVADAVAKLIDAGIPVLNQTVLLRDVNDNVDALADLSRILVDHRIQPYYLHQLDRVRGAAHFEVPQAEGLALIEELRKILPGYAVPTYVRENDGEPSKSPLTPSGSPRRQ